MRADPPAIIELHEPDGGTARVSPRGGQLLGWRPASEADDRLFLSPDCRFDAGASIRGGIPVIFPQFASFGGLRKHGFARTRDWQVVQVGDQHAQLLLTDDDDTRAVWPHQFRLTTEVRLSARRVSVSLQVENTGNTAMTFTAALHTYLRVADIATVGLTGLGNTRFWDATRAFAKGRQDAVVLRIDGELDRVYLDTPESLIVDDGVRQTTVSQHGFDDTVVWNPGIEKAEAMDDMPLGAHRHMLCVEAAQVAQPVELAPGRRWQAEQILQRGA